MPPRILVVRSGTRSVLEEGAPAGVEIVERVSHAVEPVSTPGETPEEPVDLALFTSRVAVARALGRTAPGDLRRRLSSARIAAVGPSTAAALREAGLEPSIVAAGSSQALLDALPARLDGLRALWLCGEDADDRLERGLADRGARVERRVVYRKIPAPADPSLEREVLDRPFSAFAATSPAAARWLWESLGPEARARLRATPAVALGPSTRAALAERGISRIETTAAASLSEALRVLTALAGGGAPK